MKLDFFNQFTIWHFIYLAYTMYACYQVFKWAKKALRIFLDWTELVVDKLTPKSVIQRRKQIENQLRIDLKNERSKEKERQHQEALESHRKYESVWINLGFIEEDRATLFRGYEDIKWLWGCHRIKDPKKFNPIEAQEISHFMFVEICAYRWEFKKHGKWTANMENFFRKMMPKTFLSGENDYQSELFKKAESDFNSNAPTKASA